MRRTANLIVTFLLLTALFSCDGSNHGVDTDTRRPTVEATSPVANSVDELTTIYITARLSEEIDPNSVTETSFFVTASSNGESIQGILSCLGQTMTFAPVDSLAFDETFIVTLTTGIRDMAGNPMQGDYS